MNLSGKNYAGIYKLQDKVLKIFAGAFSPFYLTGGTALGRFYLNHRYSDDLDFFVNQDTRYAEQTSKMIKILRTNFRISEEKLITFDDYTRVWISDDSELKVEFVNDVAERWQDPVFVGSVPVDSVSNILANKITALISRDEPKDVFDIVMISLNYSFSWDEVFTYALKKSLIAEPDVLMRLNDFPVELLCDQEWMLKPFDSGTFKIAMDRIADDFLLAGENSLGQVKISLTQAKPVSDSFSANITW
jgi:hypothetical protein